MSWIAADKTTVVLELELDPLDCGVLKDEIGLLWVESRSKWGMEVAPDGSEEISLRLWKYPQLALYSGTRTSHDLPRELPIKDVSMKRLSRKVAISYSACLFALFATLLATGTCLAQQPNPTDDAPIVKQFLHEEWAIWSSPARVHRSDAPWIGGLAVSSAILLKTDRNISWEVAKTDDWTRPSHIVSSFGNGLPLVAAPLGIFAVGKLTHNGDLSKTGTLGLMAVGHATVVSQVVKQISGRERPMTGDGLGEFRKGGSSFPSGHAMTSWALATVVARRSNNKWVKLGSYGFAATVGLSRVGGRNHFPSDVLVGSATGYLIGRYVTRESK